MPIFLLLLNCFEIYANICHHYPLLIISLITITPFNWIALRSMHTYSSLPLLVFFLALVLFTSLPLHPLLSLPPSQIILRSGPSLPSCYLPYCDPTHHDHPLPLDILEIHAHTFISTYIGFLTLTLFTSLSSKPYPPPIFPTLISLPFPILTSSHSISSSTAIPPLPLINTISNSFLHLPPSSHPFLISLQTLPAADLSHPDLAPLLYSNIFAPHLLLLYPFLHLLRPKPSPTPSLTSPLSSHSLLISLLQTLCTTHFSYPNLLILSDLLYLLGPKPSPAPFLTPLHLSFHGGREGKGRSERLTWGPLKLLMEEEKGKRLAGSGE